MAVTMQLRFKTNPDDKWGAEFDPATDRLYTAEELADLNKRWASPGVTVFKPGDGVRTTHQGAVLATRERNYHDDSDFYAIVWDDEKQTITTVDYGSTRSWTYLNNAVEDAAPEVTAKVAAWAAAELEQHQRYLEAADKAEVRVGVQVEVVKGRKVPKGTRATVAWRGKDRFNTTSWYTAYRVGLDIDGERVFLSEDNVRRVDAPTEFPRPANEYAHLLRDLAERHWALTG